MGGGGEGTGDETEELKALMALLVSVDVHPSNLLRGVQRSGTMGTVQKHAALGSCRALQSSAALSNSRSIPLVCRLHISYGVVVQKWILLG